MKKSVLLSSAIGCSSFVCFCMFGLTAFNPKSNASSPESSMSQNLVKEEDAPRSSIIEGMQVVRQMSLIDSPEDIEGLTKRADLILVVKIKQNLQESEPYIVRNSEGGIAAFASFTQVEVRKVIKGSSSLKGKNIRVAQELLIDKDKFGRPIVLAGETEEALVKGGRYIVFLEKTLGVEGYAPISFLAKHNTDGSDKSEERIKSEKYQELRRQVRQQIKDDQP
jgi:hypothetical protein